jgi:hypothetical protein
MADKKISQLTAATTPLAGTEVLPVVQSGSTVKVPVSDLTAGRAVALGSATVTGDLTVDTNTLYANSTGNEVCVGTTTSINVGKFNVKGDSAHNGISSTPYANAYYTYYGTNTGGTGTFYVRGDGISYFAGEMNVNGQLNNTGNHAINSGNLFISTAGKGIDFSANTGAAGMTSELLDWYEEGTWTPLVTDGTNDATMGGDNGGKYTRIGNCVTFSAYVSVQTIGSVGASARVAGLPFASDSGAIRSAAAVGYGASLNINAGEVVGAYVQAFGNTFLRLTIWDAATGTSDLDGTQISDGGAFFISGHYYVD